MQSFIKLFGDFGVQPVLLLAQVVNFAILVFLLKLVLYKPVRKMLEERRARIAEGLSDAQKAVEDLERAQEKAEKILEKAQKNSTDTLKEAKSAAGEIVDQARDKATKEAERVKKEAVAEIEAQKEAAIRLIRKEAGHLSVEVAARVMRENLTSEQRTKMVKQATEEIDSL